jgi:uncharacterized protein YecT (DUF1311 family)
MKLAVWAVLLSAFVGPVASAKDRTPCDDPITIREAGACAETKLAEADAELNRMYAALLAKERGNPAFVEKLRKAQLAWIAFRDAELEAMYACAEDGAPSNVGETSTGSADIALN